MGKVSFIILCYCLFVGIFLRNIDSRIEMAELEYKIEKDQLDILNISQKIQIIQMNVEKQKYTEQLTRKEFLYNYVKEGNVTVLTSFEITSEHNEILSIRSEGFGLIVNQNVLLDIQVGDRVFEINTINVFKITADDWDIMKSELKYPLQAVVMHVKINENMDCQKDNDKTDINNLKGDIAMIQSKLEQKLSEGRNVTNELEKVQKEKTAVFKENTRLNHRIAYLEDHTHDLQFGLKQVWMFNIE